MIAPNTFVNQDIPSHSIVVGGQLGGCMALQPADLSADRQRRFDAAGVWNLLFGGRGEDHRADDIFYFCRVVYQESD